MQCAAESNADVPHVRLGGLFEWGLLDSGLWTLFDRGLTVFDCSTLLEAAEQRAGGRGTQGHTVLVTFTNHLPLTLSYCPRITYIEEISDSGETSGIFCKMFPAAFRSRLAARICPMISQKRAAGGGLNKNIRVDENSGLREISYWTWEFSATSCSRILLYWILPSMGAYSLMVTEFVSEIFLHAISIEWLELEHFRYFNRNIDFNLQDRKNAQIGRKQSYGIIPPGPAE